MKLFNNFFRTVCSLSFLSATLALGLWACGDDDDKDPTVEIVEPGDGATVKGPNILLRIHTHDFGAGHNHIYLDKPATTDAAATEILEEGVDTVTLTGVAPGAHYINVQGSDENHKFFPSMKDSVAFTVN